ncbi:MAG: helix-turn-helix transcriptional regulator [Polyangia bacterium]|jgi:excisionase family DNA binding protein
MKTQSPLWRYSETAAFLGIPSATLRGLVHRGAIPHIRISERVVLFSPEAVYRWLAQRTRVDGRGQGRK